MLTTQGAFLRRAVQKFLLPALERANLDADFLEALAELYPTCEAFYFQSCGKLFLAEAVRSHQIEGSDRFIRFGVNVRFFNIEGTEDMLIDTVGMSISSVPSMLKKRTLTPKRMKRSGPSIWWERTSSASRSLPQFWK